MGVRELAKESRQTANESISLQIAVKARSAVASYFSPHEHSDGTDANKWCVREDESGAKYGYGNPARDTFVRQFMRGHQKKNASEYVPAKAFFALLDTPTGVKGFSDEGRVWFKTVSSSAFYGIGRMCRWASTVQSVVAPHKGIEYGRTLCSIGRRLSQRALNCISKKIRKTNDAAQAAKRCRSRCSSPCSTASCGVLIGMVNRSPATFQNTEPTNSWFTSHIFCRAGAQYRFMYAQPGRRWSLRMIK
ncbi:hypothetical protein GQ600_7865 [Phytophthora cactorum]|nr:hypothetical protein GQ600_7865 [Phytophthora cactorum]